MLSDYSAAHVFRRCKWSMRYVDAEVEGDYLTFCHESPYPRLLQLGVYAPFSAMLCIVALLTESARNPRDFTLISTALYLLMPLLLPLTFKTVAQQIGMSEHGRAYLCEYLTTFTALAARLSDITVFRVLIRMQLPSGAIFATTLLNERAGTLIWYISLAPPRAIVGLPASIFVAVVFTMASAFKGMSELADWCAALLLGIEIVVTVSLLRVWESDRRRNFEARTALAYQNHRGRALIGCLSRELRVHSHALALISATAAQHPQHSRHTDGSRRGSQSSARYLTSSTPEDNHLNLVLADAAIVTIKIIASASSEGPVDWLETKRALALATDWLGLCMHGIILTRVGSAHDVMCFAIVAEFDTLSQPSQAASLTPSEVACSFARLTHKLFAHARAGCAALNDNVQNTKLRIGISAGSLRWAAGVLLSRPTVERSIRLCDLALPGSTLIGNEVRGLAAGTFTTTLLHETVLDGRRAALHLLGMPWSDAGLLWEATLQRRLRVVDGASTGDLPELPTSSGSVGGAFEDLADEAQAESTVEFRWSWLFGWYFVDAEVEDEFRSQECRGPARLFPAAVTVGVCFVVMGWYLSSGLEALKPLCWVTWGAATVLAFATIPVAWPLRLGQRRMVVLTALIIACAFLLSLSLRFLDDYHNPMRLYMVSTWAYALFIGIAWLPSCLPAPLIIFIEIACCKYAAPRILWVDNQRYFVPLMSITYMALIMQAVRCRNRWLFADSLAARRSRETWLAARDQLERAFQRIVPAEVARRVVTEGTTSIVKTRRAQSITVTNGMRGVEDIPEKTTSQWLRFDIHLDSSAVLAMQINRADDEFHDDDCEEATCIVNAQLTACCTARDGMLWCMAGTTWLLVALRDEDNSATKFLTDAAKDIEDAMRSIGYAVVTGIGRGRLSGDLVGHRSRRYEVCGEAVAIAMASMAEGTGAPHLHK
jgi:hypothetical protein